MEIKNNIYSSIEQITGQYLNQKTKVNSYVLEESEIRFLPVNTNLFNKAIKIYSSQWS